MDEKKMLTWQESFPASTLPLLTLPAQTMLAVKPELAVLLSQAALVITVWSTYFRSQGRLSFPNKLQIYVWRYDLYSKATQLEQCNVYQTFNIMHHQGVAGLLGFNFPAKLSLSLLILFVYSWRTTKNKHRRTLNYRKADCLTRIQCGLWGI